MSDGLASEDGVETVGHLALPSFEHMAVGVRGQDDRAVAEQVLDVFEREALGQQERRSRMSEIMEATVGEASPVEGPVERARHRGGIERGATARRKDVHSWSIPPKKVTVA